MRADLYRVAKMAYADQFITELPQGFDTEVGKEGLSCLVVKDKELRLLAPFEGSKNINA